MRQITLGGEIADDVLLHALSARYPKSRVTHIYASTEAGVGFSVRDGRAGFPTSFLDGAYEGARIKVVDDMLWLKPVDDSRNQPQGRHLARDSEDFIRTGDRVRIEGDRVYFSGREDGVVNVGGVKLQLETIESVALQHPGVAACTVTAKRNPVVGALLVFTIVPKDRAANRAAFLAEFKAWCRTRLQREAQPASVRLVDKSNSTAAGKTARSVA